MRLWPKRRLYRVLMVLGGLVLGVAVIDQVWVWADRRLTIGVNTTRITSPLSPEGYPDYLAAINAKHAEGVTVENNAAIPLWQALGDMADPLSAATVYHTWGVPQPASGARLMEYREWAARRGSVLVTAGAEAVAFDGVKVPAYEDPYYWEEQVSREAPWSAAAHPLLATWQKQIDPILNQVEAAVQRPRYYVPLTTPDGKTGGAGEGAVVMAVLPKLGIVKTCGNALMSRAMARLDAGDATGFSRDIATCERLARLLTQQPDLITHLVGAAIDTMALRAVQAAGASGRLSAKDADNLRAELDRIGSLPSPAHALDEGERYMALDMICTVRRAKSDGDFVKGMNVLSAVVPVNFDATMRRVNTRMDRLVSACELAEYALRRDEFGVYDAEIEAMRARGILLKFWHAEDLPVAAYSAPLVKTNIWMTANLVERDLALTALALCSSRAGGAYPEKLADLKGFVAPVDQFTGEPLIYRRKGAGYVLYSVGENLKDDGGVRAKIASKGDLAVEAAQ